MALAEAALGICAFGCMHVNTWVRSWEENAAYSDVRGCCVTPCSLSQLKLEDRSVVPRDVVRHMRSTVSLGAGVAWGLSGPGLPCWLVLCACLGLDAFSSPGQSVWHRDRRQHRLCRQAHRHQLHHLSRQQQGPPAHLGEQPHPPAYSDVPPALQWSPPVYQCCSFSACGQAPVAAPLVCARVAPLARRLLGREVGTHSYASSVVCWCGFHYLTSFLP